MAMTNIIPRARHRRHARSSAPTLGGWISGPGLPLCGRCGQPRPADGNDWCTACENQDGADTLAALRSPAPVTAAMLGALFPGWAFTCDPGMGVWCAERRRGTEIRFLCAATVRDLAAKVAAAER